MGAEGSGETAAKQEAASIVSEEATPIGYWRTGEGTPLVLVHGTSADHTRWAPVLPVLEEHFTVYALDRRGQGGAEMLRTTPWGARSRTWRRSWTRSALP